MAIDQKTSMEFEGKSDNEGSYLIGPMPVGMYKVHIHAQGFMDLVYDQVSLIPQATVTLDATLRVGNVSEAVEVNASPMMVSTDSAMISTQQVTVMGQMAPGVMLPALHLRRPHLHRAFETTSRRHSYGIPRSSQLQTVRQC